MAGRAAVAAFTREPAVPGSLADRVAPAAFEVQDAVPGTPAAKIAISAWARLHTVAQDVALARGAALARVRRVANARSKIATRECRDESNPCDLCQHAPP